MGMPAVETRRWTAVEVQNLPEEPGKRFEGVDGELLRRALVLPVPLDYVLDPFTVVEPDITVVPTPTGRVPNRDEEPEPPVLFIEVLSPSTARYDRVVKRKRYQRQGIEYWIVDVAAFFAEVHGEQ